MNDEAGPNATPINAAQQRIAAAARQAQADLLLLQNRSLDEIVENGTWLLIDSPRELFEAAERRARAELALEPGSAAAMTRLARCLSMRANGQSWQEQDIFAKDAEELLDKALQSDPQQAPAAVSKGVLLLRAARWRTNDEAVPLISRALDFAALAIEQADGQHRAWTLQGAAYRQLAHRAPSRGEALSLYGQSSQSLERALHVRPDFYPALTERGYVIFDEAHQETGGPEAEELFVRSVEQFQAALAIHPNHEDSLLGRAIALRGRATLSQGRQADGLLAEAVELCERAFRIWPNSFHALRLWGEVIREQARRRSGPTLQRLCDSAAEKYKRALSIKPDDVATQASYGSLLMFQMWNSVVPGRAKLLAEADSHIQEALHLRPDYPWFLNLDADRLRLQGNLTPDENAFDLFRKGIESCQKALTHRLDYPGAFVSWARLLIDQAARSTRVEALSLLHQASEKADEGHQLWHKHEGLLRVRGDCLLELAARSAWSEALPLVEQAEQLYQRTLAIWPENYEALRGSGRATLFAARRANPGDIAAAFARVYERYVAALKPRPEDPAMLFDWGEALRLEAAIAPGRRQRLLEEAEEKLRSGLSLVPRQPVGLARLAATLADKAWHTSGPDRESIIKEATENLTSALEAAPDYYTLCNLGRVLTLRAKGRSRSQAFPLYTEAIVNFNRALQLRPDGAWALDSSAWTLEEQARLQSGSEAERLRAVADERFQTALQAEPDSPWRLTSYANALVARAQHRPNQEAEGIYRQAYALFERAVEIWPEYASAHAEWARALAAAAAQFKDSGTLYDAAEQRFETALEWDKQNCDIYRDWGRALTTRARLSSGQEAMKWFASALRRFDQALDCGASRERILLDRAALLEYQAKKQEREQERKATFDQARADLYEAVAKSPKSDEALYALARMLHNTAAAFKGEDADTIEELYKRAHEAAPFRADILLDWARLLQKQGRFRDAAEQAQAVLTLDPDSAKAHSLRADVLRAAAQMEKGETSVKNLLEQAEWHSQEVQRIEAISVDPPAA